MALLLGLWTLGWAFGPTFYGGEDTSLLPEHFRFLPVSWHKLARSLLGASAVSIPVIISLIAFSSLTIYGASLGIGSALISIPAIILQLALAIVLCRIATSGLRRLARSQVGALISSVLLGALQAFFVTGWFVLVGAFLAGGFPPLVSTLLYTLPSGWGVFAVDAAHSGQWLLAGSALVGLALLTVSLVPIWEWLLRRRLTTKRVHGRLSARTTSRNTPRYFTTPTGAVVRKEYITWIRDHTRAASVYFALAYALFIGLYPLFAGIPDALPWVGVIFVVSLVGAAANLYGYEGSGLWTTLTTPNAMRHDVRGRQIAWLLAITPVALAVTLGLVAASGLYWTLPLVLASLAAALGGGAGLMVCGSIYWLVPTSDPHKESDDTLDKGSDVGKFIALLLATLLLAAPAFGVALLGLYHDMLWLQWAGVLLGIASGVLWAWLFGALAYLRLEERGPELLNFMLKGTSIIPEKAKIPRDVSRKLTTYGVLGGILLGPQALLPLIFTLQGENTRIWFLPMYLEPGATRIWAISLFGVAGVTCLAIAARIYWGYRKKQSYNKAD